MCFWCYLEVFLWEAVELLPNQGMLSLVMCVWRFLPCSSSPSQTSTAIELGLRGTWELHITVHITNSHTARDLTLTRFLVFLGDCTAVPQTLNKAQNRFIFLGGVLLPVLPSVFPSIPSGNFAFHSQFPPTTSEPSAERGVRAVGHPFCPAPGSPVSTVMGPGGTGDSPESISNVFATSVASTIPLL